MPTRHRLLELTPQKEKPFEDPRGLLPEDAREILALQLGIDPELLELEDLLLRRRGQMDPPFQNLTPPPPPSGPGLLGPPGAGDPSPGGGPGDGGTVDPFGNPIGLDLDPLLLLMLQMSRSQRTRTTRGRLGLFGTPSRSSFGNISQAPGF